MKTNSFEAENVEIVLLKMKKTRLIWAFNECKHTHRRTHTQCHDHTYLMSYQYYHFSIELLHYRLDCKTHTQAVKKKKIDE